MADREPTPDEAATALQERLRLYRIAKEGAWRPRELFDARGRVWTAGSGVPRTRDASPQLTLADANCGVTTLDDGRC